MGRYFKSAGAFFRAMPTLILFELLYKLILTAIGAPIVILLINIGMKSVNMTYITAENVGKFFKAPFVIFIIFVIITAVAFTTLIEISAIIAYLSAYRSKVHIGVLGMFHAGFKTAFRMLRPRNLIALPYLYMLLPLTQLTTASVLLSAIGIPTNRLITDSSDAKMALRIYIVAVILLSLFLISRIYSLHFFTLTNLSFGKCIKKSRSLTKGRRITLAASIILWSVFLTALCAAAIFVLSFLAAYIIKGFSSPVIAASSALKVFSDIVNIMTVISSVLVLPVLFSYLTFCFFSDNSQPELVTVSFDRPNLHSKKVRVCTAVVVALSIFLNYSYIQNISEDNIGLGMSFLARTKVSAHRGASYDAPENTSYAFLKAVKQGADYIELDVQQSADGQVVVFHDKSLKRITGVDKNVSDLTYDQLSQLDCGSWCSEEYSDARIMLLSDVLDLVGDDINLNIEVKSFGNASQTAIKTAKLVKEYNCDDSCYITSFSYSALKAVKKTYPHIKTGIITNVITYSSYSRLKYIDAMSLNQRFITQNVVSTAHMNGKKVFAWTVDTRAEMDELITLGVDNIITDRPSTGVKAVYSEGTQSYIMSILSWIFN